VREQGHRAAYGTRESGADALLGSRLQDGLADTNTDPLFGALGSAVGGWLLVIWTRRGWAVMRRVPADALIALFGRGGVTRATAARKARSRRD
jgi:hypothetical protein